jgi:hypothetical protein
MNWLVTVFTIEYHEPKIRAIDGRANKFRLVELKASGDRFGDGRCSRCRECCNRGALGEAGINLWQGQKVRAEAWPPERNTMRFVNNNLPNVGICQSNKHHWIAQSLWCKIQQAEPAILCPYQDLLALSGTLPTHQSCSNFNPLFLQLVNLVAHKCNQR